MLYYLPLDSDCGGYCPPVHAGLPQAHCCSALGKVAEASLNGQQLSVCPRAVRTHQSGGSANQRLQEEVEELGVRGWREDCRSLPEIVGCAVYSCLDSMFCIDSGFGISCLRFSTLPQGHLHRCKTKVVLEKFDSLSLLEEGMTSCRNIGSSRGVSIARRSIYCSVPSVITFISVYV